MKLSVLAMSFASPLIHDPDGIGIESDAGDRLPEILAVNRRRRRDNASGETIDLRHAFNRLGDAIKAAIRVLGSLLIPAHVQGVGVTSLINRACSREPVADGSTKEQEELDARGGTQVPPGPDLAEHVPNMLEASRVRRRYGVEVRDAVRFVNRHEHPHEVEEEGTVVSR